MSQSQATILQYQVTASEEEKPISYAPWFGVVGKPHWRVGVVHFNAVSPTIFLQICFTKSVVCYPIFNGKFTYSHILPLIVSKQIAVFFLICHWSKWSILRKNASRPLKTSHCCFNFWIFSPRILEWWLVYILILDGVCSFFFFGMGTCNVFHIGLCAQWADRFAVVFSHLCCNVLWNPRTMNLTQTHTNLKISKLQRYLFKPTAIDIAVHQSKPAHLHVLGPYNNLEV